MMDMSLTAQLAEARRELATRRRVYPRWITQGHLRADVAEHRLALMEAIVGTLQERVEQASGQQRLFE